jgi:hypothetical protein
MTRAPRPRSSFEDAAQSPPSVTLTELSDVDLIEWVRRSMFATGLAPRFTLRRYRWRRTHSAAITELSTRLLRFSGSSSVCDVCRERRPTHHSIRNDETGPVFAHHCGACAKNAEPGWFGCAMIEQ